MQVVAAHRLGQPDLSGQGAGVGHLGAVEGDEPAPLCPVAVGGVIDADDDHLVVGEQVTLDRLGEPEPVEHRAERCLVVHRGDLKVGFFGFPHDPAGEVARGGRHEQSAARLDGLGVEDGGEVGGDAPGAAMGLIGDDQVEGGHPTQPKRLGDLRRRLVGGKHDTRAGPPAQERRDLLGVGGDREAQITGVRHDRIRFGDGLVGTHRKEVESRLGVGRPLAQRLGQQRQRRHQHQRAFGGELLV